MRVLSRLIFFSVFFTVLSSRSYAQPQPNTLIERMRQHEHSILNAYLEYQKLYYEDKSQAHELLAFEELLTVYINQVMEIFETLNLSEKKNEAPRDITARSLIFKNLMFLEKAPLNISSYEKACYEYYEALNLYNGTDVMPVIYKDLPQPIQTGDKTYFRLIELLEDKGRELQNFGKVNISFRNFMVTANFDPEKLELIKIQRQPITVEHFTFDLAEARIKKAFAEVFHRSKEVKTYVALPHGTYVLRLNSGGKSSHTSLTRFYVRANQEQHYIMEPLADWIILYENPTSKRPDYFKFRRNQPTTDSLKTKLTNGHSNGSAQNAPKSTQQMFKTKYVKLVSEIVAEYLPNFEIIMTLDSNDSEVKGNVTQVIAETIVAHVESSSYYNKWNEWTASWEISNQVRNTLSPGSLVPTELVELVYQVLKEL